MDRHSDYKSMKPYIEIADSTKAIEMKKINFYEMKTSEHLAFLQRIAPNFNAVRNTGDISKGLLD